MQSVEIYGLDEIVKRLEELPDAVRAARAEYFSEVGQTMLSAVQSRIGGTGRVSSAQGLYIGSGKGYAAVRAKANTELKGYAAGYVTNALEGGHPSRNKEKARVPGKYMYRNTEPEMLRLAEAGAREIEKKALAYLESEE